MNMYNNDIFLESCKEGNLEKCVMMYSNKNVSINNVILNRGFNLACNNGHLLVMQWLLSVKQDINMCVNNEEIFVSVCSNGYLSIAKWLLSINPAINMSSNNNELCFQNACANGHLLVAQWLLSVNPDINMSAQNEYAFRMVCANGYLYIAKWLLDVNPDMNIPKNYYCYNVFDKLKKEQRWKKRKYALLLSSRFSKNKNNVLRNMPQDVVRYIINYI